MRWSPLSHGLIALFVCLCCAAPAWAQQGRKSAAELRQAGVNVESFQPIKWSHNDKWLAAFDEATFEEKKQGVFFRLWLLEIGSDGSINRLQKVPLKMANFLQGEFTPNDDAYIIMGNRGTTWMRLDMKTFAVTPLLEPREGEPGFRSEPTVLWTDAGSLYTVGYPYDEHRFVNARTIATINPNATGAEAYKPGPDLTTLEKGIERMWMTNYLSPTSIFYGQHYSDTVVLSHWDGRARSEFDRCARLWGSWGNAGRLLYSAERSPEVSELMVFDSKTGQKSVLASGPDVYRYLFLSGDGGTALVSLMVPEGRRLNTFFARASDGWKLRPVEAEAGGRGRTMAAGFMRLSTRGGLMAHISANGLVIYPLAR